MSISCAQSSRQIHQLPDLHQLGKASGIFPLIPQQKPLSTHTKMSSRGVMWFETFIHLENLVEPVIIHICDHHLRINRNSILNTQVQMKKKCAAGVLLPEITTWPGPSSGSGLMESSKVRQRSALSGERCSGRIEDSAESSRSL